MLLNYYYASIPIRHGPFFSFFQYSFLRVWQATLCDIRAMFRVSNSMPTKVIIFYVGLAEWAMALATVVSGRGTIPDQD